MEFPETSYLNNLTSVLSFYAYMIIGIDYDSFFTPRAVRRTSIRHAELYRTPNNRPNRVGKVLTKPAATTLPFPKTF